jgi:hypothetical protein
MKSSRSGVCEASKCFAEATTMVRVSAGIINGRQIAIPLSLCSNCVRKFDIIKEKEEEGLAPQRPKPNGNHLRTDDNTASQRMNQLGSVINE